MVYDLIVHDLEFALADITFNALPHISLWYA